MERKILHVLEFRKLVGKTREQFQGYNLPQGPDVAGPVPGTVNVFGKNYETDPQNSPHFEEQFPS